ncbi:hypothetical protein [Escherichia phage Ioannina]|nr:hypothetical protein [Escherichia phage Ioannina]
MLARICFLMSLVSLIVVSSFVGVQPIYCNQLANASKFCDYFYH